MGYYTLLFAAGLFGLFGHWFNRYRQKRTDERFIEYMTNNINDSLASIFANVAATGTAYATLPETPSERELIIALNLAFTAGYMLDSVFNKSGEKTDGN